MPGEELKVMIVDDTIVYRKILSNAIESIPGCVASMTASNGKIALGKLESSPVDIVLLDVEMPEMGGLEALEEIHRRYPGIAVIMVSGVSKNAAGVTIEALEKGALDFVSKPESSDRETSQEELTKHLRRLIGDLSKRKFNGAGAKVKQPAAKPVVRATSPAPTNDVTLTPPKVSKGVSRIDIVVIGISTGGPQALADTLPRLPEDLGVPIVIVQHMPPLFTASLAESLAKKSKLDVKEAENGDLIKANQVLIAPGGQHTLVRRAPTHNGSGPQFCIGLNDSPPENNCRPSVDVLFRSIASHYGENVLSVIMTGMGNDGCNGVKALKRQGAYCLTQKEGSCVVYGMPRCVDEAGLSDEQVPLRRIAERITELVERNRSK